MKNAANHRWVAKSSIGVKKESVLDRILTARAHRAVLLSATLALRQDDRVL
jgi:hypothetical protein